MADKIVSYNKCETKFTIRKLQVSTKDLHVLYAQYDIRSMKRCKVELVIPQEDYGHTYLGYL